MGVVQHHKVTAKAVTAGISPVVQSCDPAPSSDGQGSQQLVFRRWLVDVAKPSTMERRQSSQQLVFRQYPYPSLLLSKARD